MKTYDLAERTTAFSEKVISFLSSLPRNLINNTLIDQAMRSGTSVGANYMEADTAQSRKDFEHKISICRKEAKETRYWFQLIAKANPEKVIECREFYKEAHEFVLIFSTIIKSSKDKSGH